MSCSGRIQDIEAYLDRIQIFQQPDSSEVVYSQLDTNADILPCCTANDADFGN